MYFTCSAYFSLRTFIAQNTRFRNKSTKNLYSIYAHIFSPSAQSNILVENLNLIPAGISNETAMTHNCIRFDSDDSGIVTDGQKLGKMLKINEDSITENKESSSISFMTKLYNFDTDIDKNPLKLVQFGNYLVQLVTKDSTKTLQFINVSNGM